MNTTTLQVPLTKSLKTQAKAVARDYGFSSLQELVRFLLTKVSKRELTVNAEEPSDYLIRVMKQAEKNLKTGNHSPAFKTGEEAVAWLEKQGI